MKTKNIFLEIILIVILVGFVTSCSNYENNSFSEMTTKISSLRLNVGVSGYVDGVATRSASTWNDGSKIYIYSSSLSGTATYKNGTWVLSYTGNIVGENDCKIYYFENPVSNGETSVDMNAFTAAYTDDLAKMSKIGEEIVLTGVLKPKSARIRFKKTGDDVTFSGFTSYNKYDNNLNNLREQKEISIELSATSDFTPYIYLAYEGHNIDVSLIANGCLFKRTLTEEHLAPGNSGYFVTPTKEYPNGWTFVGEAPIPVWDGNVASKFAGGSGTFIDPYLIKTGGQLALVSNYNSAYFKLVRDIDLNDCGFKPIASFSGNFDGNNKTISNLRINRADDYLGLFSVIEQSGVVKNLNIKGVKIGTTSNKYIGCIAGKNYGHIDNCNIEFKNDSYVKGAEIVGGLVGDCADGEYSSSCNVQNCMVKSSFSDAGIFGNNYVGGIVGMVSYNYYNNNNGMGFNNCHAQVNIKASYGSGGIVGFITKAYKVIISECSYWGNITSEESVGGIVGDIDCRSSGMKSYISVKSCKTNANITVSGKYAGGIVGIAYYPNRTSSELRADGDYNEIISCYSTGTITTSGSSKYVGGISGFIMGSVNCCYSTMTGNSSNFYGISYGAYSLSDCVTTYSVFGKSYYKSYSNCYANAENGDIIDILRSSGSQFSSCWNYNNSWIWTGTINGKSVTAICPRLSWE